jgi:Zn-dependent protease with chaperone function
VITRHPVLGGLAVAVMLCLGLAGVALSVYSAQEVPWALAMVVVVFPFAWFFAWVLINGFAWWRETTR